MLGRWDEALAVTADEQPLAQSMAARSSLASAALVHSDERGDATAARSILAANDAVRDSRPSLQSPLAMTPPKPASCAPRDMPPMRWLRPSACSNSARSWASTTSTSSWPWSRGLRAALELSDAEKAEELLKHPRVPRPGRAPRRSSKRVLSPPCSSGGGARPGGRHRRALRQRRRPLPRVRHGLPPRRHGARARRVACRVRAVGLRRPSRCSPRPARSSRSCKHSVG